MHPLMGRRTRRVIPCGKGGETEEAQHSNEDFEQDN